MSELPATIVPVPFHVINHAVLSTPVSVASVPSLVVNLEGQHPPPPLQIPPEDFRVSEPSPRTGPSIFSIDTNYDPSHKKNTMATYRSKARDRYYLTQEQRKYASRAKIPYRSVLGLFVCSDRVAQHCSDIHIDHIGGLLDNDDDHCRFHYYDAG